MLFPNFKFKYNGIDFSTLEKEIKELERSTVYILKDGLEVILEKNLYPKYDAIEWVLHFKYKTIFWI